MSENYRDLIPVPLNPSHFLLKDGEYWMTAQSIGEVLGYQNPSESVINLYNRHREQFKDFSTIIKLMTVDGKEREQRIFSEEGIYLISIYANTPTARKFQVQVAKFLKAERLKRQEAKEREYQRKESDYRFELSLKDREIRAMKEDTAAAAKELFTKFDAKTVELVARCRAAGLSVRDCGILAGITPRAAGRLLKLSAKLPATALVRPQYLEKPKYSQKEIWGNIMNGFIESTTSRVEKEKKEANNENA